MRTSWQKTRPERNACVRGGPWAQHKKRTKPPRRMSMGRARVPHDVILTAIGVGDDNIRTRRWSCSRTKGTVRAIHAL